MVVLLGWSVLVVEIELGDDERRDDSDGHAYGHADRNAGDEDFGELLTGSAKFFGAHGFDLFDGGHDFSFS